MGWRQKIKQLLEAPSPQIAQKDGEYQLRRGEKSQIICTGRHSYGIKKIRLRSWGEGANLYIGSFCSISRGLTVLLGGNHRTDWTTTFPFGHVCNDTFPSGQVNGGGHPATKGHIIIENDVWIGQGCTIMSGLRIGSGSVLAANFVVTKDVEPYAIVGGNPAKLIKKRFPHHTIQQLLELKWWDRSDAEINKIVPLLQTPLSEEVLKEIIATLNAI